MSPSPPAIPPSSTISISPDTNIYLGKNVTIQNTSSGFSTTLPITTQNVLTCQAGLNISSSGSAANLSIDANGNFNTAGTMNVHGSITTDGSFTASGSLNAKSLNINTDKFTVSDTGRTTMLDDLTVGSYFTVTESTGAVTVGSTIYSAGTVSIGGTNVSPNLTLGNDGHILALNDITIGTGEIIFSHGSGNAQMNGDVTIGQGLNVHSNQLIIDAQNNVANINCPANILGNLNINSSQFTVDSVDGSIVSNGSLTVEKNVNIGADNVLITSTTGKIQSIGNLQLGTFSTPTIQLNSSDGSIAANGGLAINTTAFTVAAATGAVTTAFPYSSYVIPSSSSNTTTTEVSGTAVDFTSSTAQYLATQTYVDKQLWNQTVRINTILGTDGTVLDSFNNVYKLVQALEGSTTATAIGDITNQSSQIKESVSTVVANAYNTVLINCSSAVWADECAPYPIPYTITANNETVDGWWFKNLAQGNKINWYLPANNNMTMGDFVNLYLNVFVASTVSLPFLTVYTKAKGDSTDYWPGLVNARVNYIFNSVSTANKYYSLYTGNNAPMNNFNTTAVQCGATSTSNGQNRSTNANYMTGNNYATNLVALTDEIFAFSIGSDSVSSAGNVEFVLNSFNIQQTTGTTQMLFQNSSVSSNYMYNYLFKKNQDFSAISDKNAAYINDYSTAYN